MESTYKLNSDYLQIITILLFYSFYNEMIFLFRKRERKGVELMNLSLWIYSVTGKNQRWYHIHSLYLTIKGAGIVQSHKRKLHLKISCGFPT